MSRLRILGAGGYGRTVTEAGLTLATIIHPAVLGEGSRLQVGRSAVYSL